MTLLEDLTSQYSKLCFQFQMKMEHWIIISNVLEFEDIILSHQNWTGIKPWMWKPNCLSIPMLFFLFFWMYNTCHLSFLCYCLQAVFCHFFFVDSCELKEDPISGKRQKCNHLSASLWIMGKVVPSIQNNTLIFQIEYPSGWVPSIPICIIYWACIPALNCA